MTFFRDRNEPIHIPSMDPSTVPPPSRELYALMGEANVKALLRDFYQKLGASSIAPMFPADLDAASERSALFFIGLLGGPPLYMQAYGPPRMRMRHIPFRIDESHRLTWLACFLEVLVDHERYGIPKDHLPGFKAFLDGFSRWMVNSEAAAPPFAEG